jgi:hypothetical protein
VNRVLVTRTLVTDLHIVHAALPVPLARSVILAR